MEKTLAEGSDVSLVRARTPIEAAITEGNLAELPLFVLSNKEAKPYVIDKSTGKKHFDKELYKRTLELPKYESEAGIAERNIKILASVEYGYPTMFAYRVLIVVLDRCKQNGCISPIVEITRHEIAVALGIERPSSKDYLDIENALHALTGLKLELRGTWYERAKRRRGDSVSCSGLVADFAFQDGRPFQRSLPFDGEACDKASSTRPPNSVQLSTLLFESLQQQYLLGVDLQYLNALPSPASQKLYVYLTKKNGGRRTYSELLKGLGAKLDIKRTAPADILKTVRPALDALTAPLAVPHHDKPRRFLEAWRVLDQNRIVEVQFFQP